MDNRVFENDRYSDIIITGYGKWIDSDFKCLILRIINNIRTVNYNFEYKAPNTRPSMAGQGNIFDQMKSQVKTDPKKIE